MSATSCLATPTADAGRYTLSAASQLSIATPTSHVKVKIAKLQLDAAEYRVVGPNVYWLGLDENVVPNPSYPSKARVLEIMAVAKVMGATTIRSTSLGVSVGTGLSIENALNTFKADTSAAWDAIDFALFAARSYGIRLIIPLTDQYDYYHGGIPTFLRWRNLSSTNYDPFYDLGSEVYQDFKSYIDHLLTHVSPYTNLTLASDPTVLAFETGNELGGFTGKHFPPPVAWTTSISEHLKELAPETLVVSGSYGVRKDELAIASIDIHSDHFYPTYRSRLSSSASKAHSVNKPFLVGEFDWTNQYYERFRWGYFIVLLPALVAVAIWFLPKRWWPWSFTLRDFFSCRCCRRRKRPRRERGLDERGPYGRMSRSDDVSLTPPPTQSEDPFAKQDLEPSATLPVLETYPPQTATGFRGAVTRTSVLDRTIRIRRWMFSLFVLVLALPLFGIVYSFMPTPISPFLSSLSTLETAPMFPSRASSIGDLYWSLFGRTDSGCAFVEHNDGYTLHYPSDPTSLSGSASGSGDPVVMLTRHAWNVRQETPFWVADDARDAFDIDKLKFEDLPVVAFPQRGLELANGTLVGGE